jgi:hypothetical protein
MGLGTHERSFESHEKLWSILVDKYLLHKNPHCIHTLMVKDFGVTFLSCICKSVQLI